jgi:hypothetical protein
LNEVQRVCHKNSGDGWETKGRAPQICNDLANLYSVVLIWNSL